MKTLSTKPYFIRAVYEWCADSGLTPYLSVKANAQMRVPMEYVNDGEIVLNIGHDATRHLTLGNDAICFSARFNGVSHEMSIPISAVKGIFAKETAQGMLFQLEPEADAMPAEAAGAETTPSKPQPAPQNPAPSGNGKRRLQIVK